MKKNSLLLLAAALLAQASAAPVNPQTAQNPKAFIAQSSVKSRLSTLLGPVQMRFLQKNFGTVSTLQADRNVAAVTGCLPHACGSDSAIVVYNRATDKFAVWLKVGGKTRQRAEQGWKLPVAANSDVKASINNF